MRTTLYTVHEAPGCQRDPEGAARVIFLKDGMSVPAFLFPALWLLWHRLWLGLLMYAGVMIAMSVLTAKAGMSGGWLMLIALLPNIWIALEGNDMRRRKLARKGYRQTAAIRAEDLDEAEVLFFARWVHDASPAPTPAPRPAEVTLPPAVGRRGDNAIIGLFPEPGHPS